MRKLCCTFLLVAVASCGDDAVPPAADMTSTRDLATPADAAIAPDLTTSPIPDMTVAASPDMSELTCAQLVACIFKCDANNQNTCVPACIAIASTAAKNKLGPLQACAQPACYTTDAAMAPCANPSSQASACVQQNCGKQLTDCETN